MKHGSGAPSGAPSVPSGETAYYYDETNDVFYVWKTGASAWHTAGGGGSSLTTASAALSSNVTLTNANQYYDGPSVSLVAGTWLAFATAQLNNPTTGGTQSWTGKIWDGTTAYGSDQVTVGNSGTPVPLELIALLTPTVTTTYKISVANVTANSVMYAAALNNGAGNNASQIIALKVG